MTLINKVTHAVEWNNNATEPWLDGDWVQVPPELEATARSCGGYCELTFDEAGNLTGLTPTERPDPPEPAPSQLEQLRADVDYIAALQGVTL